MIYGYDFYYLWCAGAMGSGGGDPYSVVQLNQCLVSISWPDSEGVQALTHPPYNFWLYCLLGYFPFAFSLVLWSIISAGLCVWSGLKWWKLQDLPPYKNRIIAIMLILFFPPILSTLIWGQVNALHFFGLTGFAALYRARRYLIAGLLLSLTLTKPHLYLCTYVYLALVLARHRAWSVYAGGVLGLSAQVLISLLFFPEGWQLYVKRFSSLGEEALTLSGATLAQQLSITTGWGGFPILFCVCALIAGAFSGMREGKQLALLPLTLGVSLMCAPYCWSHGLVACLPLFLPAVERCTRTLSERQIMLLIFVVVCAVMPLIVNVHSQLVWMLMPLFGGVCWLWRPEVQSSPGELTR
jgi:hypothetical protein